MTPKASLPEPSRPSWCSWPPSRYWRVTGSIRRNLVALVGGMRAVNKWSREEETKEDGSLQRNRLPNATSRDCSYPASNFIHFLVWIAFSCDRFSVLCCFLCCDRYRSHFSILSVFIVPSNFLVDLGLIFTRFFCFRNRLILFSYSLNLVSPENY